MRQIVASFLIAIGSSGTGISNACVITIRLERINTAFALGIKPVDGPCYSFQLTNSDERFTMSPMMEMTPLFVRLLCPKCGLDFTPKLKDVVENSGNIECHKCQKPSHYRPNQLLDRFFPLNGIAP
jgi:hypothetical protein